MIAIASGECHRDAPLLIDSVVESQHQIPVDGLDLVVVAMNLPERDAVAPGHRLVLLDVLVAQVHSPAGLGREAVQVPVGVDHAECGAARGRGALTGEGGNERSRAGGVPVHE
ncbi:hypothetical protein D3C83_17590 [compost metagenome]